MFKREWTIDDYPVRVRFRPITESEASRLKPLPWSAEILNWPAVSGFADTKQGALKELRKNFIHSKTAKPKLPRPGTKVPIEFSSVEHISRHSGLAEDFVKRVLDKDWAWISDESSLWDFHEDETNERLNKKISDVYGVDVSDISSGNLVEIFDRIHGHKTASPTSITR